MKIGAQVNEIYERADEEDKTEIKLTFDYEAWKEYFKGFLRRYDREKNGHFFVEDDVMARDSSKGGQS